MTELKRWLEGGAPPEVGKLLRAARVEAPRRGTLERTLLGLGATGLATTAGAKAAAGAMAVALTWVAVGALGGSVVVGTVVGVRRLAEPSVSPALSARSPSRPAVSPSAAELRNDVPPPARPEPPREPRARAVPLLPREADHDPPAVDRRLAEEIGVIDRARASLNAGNPAATLRALDDYDGRFSERHLGPEALYLRMEARARLGDRAGAEQAAREMLEKYPDGPQVGRAEELLRSDSTGKKP